MNLRLLVGSEFISKALDLWAYDNNVTLDYSRPGKPTDNPEDIRNWLDERAAMREASGTPRVDADKAAFDELLWIWHAANPVNHAPGQLSPRQPAGPHPAQQRSGGNGWRLNVTRAESEHAPTAEECGSAFVAGFGINFHSCLPRTLVL